MRKTGPNDIREFDALLKEGKPLPDCFLAFYVKELQCADRKVHTDIAVAAEVNHDVAASIGFFSFWTDLFCKLSEVLFREPNLIQSIPKFLKT